MTRVRGQAITAARGTLSCVPSSPTDPCNLLVGGGIAASVTAGTPDAEQLVSYTSSLYAHFDINIYVRQAFEIACDASIPECEGRETSLLNRIITGLDSLEPLVNCTVAEGGGVVTSVWGNTINAVMLSLSELLIYAL